MFSLSTQSLISCNLSYYASIPIAQTMSTTKVRNPPLVGHHLAGTAALSPLGNTPHLWSYIWCFMFSMFQVVYSSATVFKDAGHVLATQFLYCLVLSDLCHYPESSLIIA